MGVVKRRVLRGLWRRLVGVGNRAGVSFGVSRLFGVVVQMVYQMVYM